MPCTILHTSRGDLKKGPIDRAKRETVSLLRRAQACYSHCHAAVLIASYGLSWSRWLVLVRLLHINKMQVSRLCNCFPMKQNTSHDALTGVHPPMFHNSGRQIKAKSLTITTPMVKCTKFPSHRAMCLLPLQLAPRPAGTVLFQLSGKGQLRGAQPCTLLYQLLMHKL